MKNVILLSTLFISIFINAQTFTGKVVDVNNQPIAFSDILIIDNTDNKIITGDITDENGNFKIATTTTKGFYLEISFIGFKTQKLQPTTPNLGTIILKEETTNLKAVLITARKKMIEQKVDRLVFNVENSIASQGTGGMELLQKVPLLNVNDKDGLSIIGKSNVRVMINGRILNLKGRELTNYLQSIQSENVKKVEVITTPPSKYDAEGNSGLVNIILKKNTKLGLNGTLNLTTEKSSVLGHSTNGTLNYKMEKFNSSLKVNHYNIGYKPKGTRGFRSKNTEIKSLSERTDKYYGFGVNFNTNYQINEKSNVGIIYNLGQTNYNMNSYDKNEYYKQVLDSTLVTNALNTSKLPNHTINTYYDVELDSMGKKMNLELNYYKVNSIKKDDLNTQKNSIINNTFRNKSLVSSDIYNARLDFTLPFSVGTLETGVKYTNFNTKSDVRLLNKVSNNYILDTDKSLLFNYSERNYALYSSFQKKINDKLSSKVGVRYEYTSLNGGKPNNTNEVKNNYGKLFPSAYLTYKYNPKNVLSLNYSKRINRPSFRNLSPYKWYTNPYIYYTGNPLLRPSFSDNVEFTYAYRSKLIFKLYNEYGTDKSTDIQKFENGVSSSNLENAYDENKTGVTIIYSNTFFKVWDFSTTTNSSYVKPFSLIDDFITSKTFTYYLKIDNTIALNKSKTLFCNLGFWYASPRIFGNLKLDKMYELSSGFRALFLDKKLKFNLRFSDILKTIVNQGTNSYTNREINFYQYNDHRKVSFSVSYAFGNNKLKSKAKKINFEEKNRVN